MSVDWARLREQAVDLVPGQTAHSQRWSPEAYQHLPDHQQWAIAKAALPAKEYRRLRRRAWRLLIADLLDPAGAAPAR